MQYPVWVASVRVQLRVPSAHGNHACVLRTKEGRTRPGLALPHISRRFQPWIKPLQAKPASSQGGALATIESVHNLKLNRTEDMILESLHD
jgi:hypothetical protein